MTSVLIIGMCLNIFSRICVNSQMESSPTGYMALSKWQELLVWSCWKVCSKDILIYFWRWNYYLCVNSSLGSKNSCGKIHVMFIFYLYCCKVKTQKNEWFPDSREPTTNLIRVWHWCQDSNLGLNGGRRVLSPWRQPCSLLAGKIVWSFFKLVLFWRVFG